MTVRLSVNLPDEAAAVLKDLADRREISLTEAVRRAIAIYKYVDDEVVTAGKQLQVVDDSDNVTSVALIS